MARYLVTSALPYINGVKHLGNLVGSMLPADAYSRFLRLQGDDVLRGVDVMDLPDLRARHTGRAGGARRRTRCSRVLPSGSRRAARPR